MHWKVRMRSLRMTVLPVTVAIIITRPVLVLTVIRRIIIKRRILILSQPNFLRTVHYVIIRITGNLQHLTMMIHTPRFNTATHV